MFYDIVHIAEKTARSIFSSPVITLIDARLSKTKEKCPIILQTAGVNFETFWDLEDDLWTSERLNQMIYVQC
jgi:hypothetical protein